MSYDALDISRYIINYCNNHDIEISNLKLQKLLYFVQAMFLVTYGVPAFFQNIVAWPYGTVVDDVYHEYKQFGSMSIPSIEYYSDFSLNSMNFETKKFDESIINSEHREKINGVLNVMANKDAFKLVDITHSQEPWIKAYKEGSGSVISNESIKEFFSR
ncbi:Panacea domain-containing protein [Peptostreptococcus sp.]